MPDDPDPWADLFADLGVESKPASPAVQPRASFLGGVPVGDSEDAPLDAGVEGEEPGEAEEPELDENGQPKRRRRRRRRGRGRKGELGVEGVGEPADGDEAFPLPPGGEPIILEAPAAYDAEGGDFDGEDSEPAGDPLDAVESQARGVSADYGVEDATPAATRELIADWNVPSWQEIVAGLYRPER